MQSRATDWLAGLVFSFVFALFGVQLIDSAARGWDYPWLVTVLAASAPAQGASAGAAAGAQCPLPCIAAMIRSHHIGVMPAADPLSVGIPMRLFSHWSRSQPMLACLM
ncbi:hypothetical protein [Synechococcus sp. WH 7805]|uniref:hypothetical protein n=1 Tax=Synechococcus sp. (strain WH7805) TaxID=59931 RepID=UPI0002DE4AC6|nr:hypothetical protein [Synechococcus sp. WH 7805]